MDAFPNEVNLHNFYILHQIYFEIHILETFNFLFFPQILEKVCNSLHDFQDCENASKTTFTLEDVLHLSKSSWLFGKVLTTTTKMFNYGLTYCDHLFFVTGISFVIRSIIKKGYSRVSSSLQTLVLWCGSFP